MIHEFSFTSGGSCIKIHVIANSREEAAYLLKAHLFNRNIQINNFCSINVNITDDYLNAQDAKKSLKKENAGRYSYVAPEELNDSLPEEEEITKPDNPIAIKKSSQKLQAIKESVYERTTSSNQTHSSSKTNRKKT